jgi:PAN domain
MSATQRLQEQTAKQADIEQGLKTERDRAFAEVAKLTATVEGLSRARPDAGPGNPTKRWLSPIAVGIVLLAAVLVGTLVFLWPGRKSDAEAETKVAELTATVTKSDKARQDVEAKVDQATAALTKSDKARQDAEAKADQATAALTKSDKARQDAEAKATQTTAAMAKSEQTRQAAEAKAAEAEKARQAAAARADDAEKARLAADAKAADADKARLAAEAKLALAIGPSPSSQFSQRSNMEVRGAGPSARGNVASVSDCELTCSQSNTCKAYTYSKRGRWCFMYSVDKFSDADLSPNQDYDSGTRN